MPNRCKTIHDCARSTRPKHLDKSIFIPISGVPEASAWHNSSPNMSCTAAIVFPAHAPNTSLAVHCCCQGERHCTIADMPRR